MSRPLVVACLVFVGAALVGCGAAATPPPASPATPKPVTIAAGGHDATLAAIGDHLGKLGWKVSPDKGQRRIVVVSPKHSKFGIGLHLGLNGNLNHIVMFKAFMPKPEAKGTPKVTELVAKLANNVNGVVYQVSDDQAVVCATWVYFLDTLDPNLLLRTLELLEQVAIVVMATQAPDLVKLLE